MENFAWWGLFVLRIGWNWDLDGNLEVASLLIFAVFFF